MLFVSKFFIVMTITEDGGNKGNKIMPIVTRRSGKKMFPEKKKFFRAAPTAYGGSQAKGQIEAAASSLHHTHSNSRSEPCL